MNTYDLLICAVFLLLLYLYYIVKRAYSYFTRHGIPYIKPVLIFGNVKEWVMMRKPLSMVYFALHKNLEPHRFAGVFIGFRPSIMIRDPELVRKILINDFAYFGSRGVREDAVLVRRPNQAVALITGEEWKSWRMGLTACFTRGKIKNYFSLANDYGIKLNMVLGSVCNEPDFEMRDLCSRYTTDMIGNFIFGIEINSLDNPDTEIKRMCHYILDVNFAFILRGLYPNLETFLKPFFKDTTIRNFFTNIINDSIKYREENQIERNDFLDKVRDLCTEGENRWTKSNIESIPNDMSTRCCQLFLSGFEPSSMILNFMMLELAQNQRIQNKLRQEIIDVLKKNDNVLTYDAMKEMKYLDMVVAETLRRYPPVGELRRKCMRSYKIPDSEVVIEKGTQVIVSILGIHYDKKNYEKPDEFYPEHFTEEAKAMRFHCTYLPFGDGPRKCLGYRFGMIQIKIGAIHLLKNYSYQVSPKTKLPVEFILSGGFGSIKGGTWLKCRKI